MRDILATLLPSVADNTVRGMKLPVYLFTAIAIVSGSAQLVYACVQLAVSFRYTPPGATANYVMLPLAGSMLALSLWSAK